MTVPITAIHQQLGQSELLAGLPLSALAELSTRVHCQSLPSGSLLCRAGEERTSAFLVVSGRFRAEAGGRVVGEIGRGELVGEISLLTGEPRSADVVATRDSEVIELPGEVFNGVLAAHPECYQVVSRQLVSRLQRVLALLDPGPRSATVTSVSDSELAVLGVRMFRVLLRDMPQISGGMMASLASQLRVARAGS